MTRLISVCTMPTVAAKKHVAAPTKRTTPSASGLASNIGDRRHTMNTPAVTMVAAWISADTGVGPSIASGSQVWRPSCARLAHRADEQQQAQHRHGVGAEPKKADRRPGHVRCGGEDGGDRDRAEHQKGAEDAEHEAQIPDPVDHERLNRGGVGARLAKPETDQQIAGEAHALPAEEHLDQIVGGHQHQHRKGEQR